MIVDKPFRIYIGYDEREKTAFDVCAYSIQKNASIPIEIYKLDKEPLVQSKVYQRHDKDVSTDFAFTRFLVPFLNKYKGWAMFLDCDMIMTVDIKELVDQIKDKYAVMLVKHPEYTPKREIKMDNQVQSPKLRKNWSSVILWNCKHEYNRSMNPSTVNNQSGAFLHRFSWLNDKYIGELDKTWNWLCDEGLEKPSKNFIPKLIHYTNGGPWFTDRPECVNCEYGDIWQKYSDELNGVGIATRFFAPLQGLLNLERWEKPRLDIREITIINKAKGCVGCQKSTKKNSK